MPLAWDTLLKLVTTVGAAVVLTGACSAGDDKPFGLQIQPAGGGSSGKTGSGGSNQAGEGSGTGGSGATGGTDPAPVGKLEHVTKYGWDVGQETTGIAVDHQGHVYINDLNNVYRVTGSEVEPFLTLEEIADEVGTQVIQIDDLDIDEDDVLYVIASGVVLETTAAHSFDVLNDLSDGSAFSFNAKLGVVEPGEVVVAKGDGIWRVGKTATNVFSAEDIGYSQGCACEDLAVASSGKFLYTPGCNGSALLRGDASGSSVGNLYQSTSSGNNPLDAQTFMCMARDPDGGFYVVALTEANETELFHLDDSNGRTVVSRVATVPALEDEAETRESPFAMRFCSIAVSREDASVSLLTFQDLWRISFD